MGKADAEKVITAFRELDIEFTPSAELLVEALRIAITHKRTVSDSF